MRVYGLQLTVRGMQPYFLPFSGFVNRSELLYGLSHTVLVETSQWASFVCCYQEQSWFAW